jgi:hypothetical protein
VVHIPYPVETLVTVALPTATTLRAGDAVTLNGSSPEAAFSVSYHPGTVVQVVDLTVIGRPEPAETDTDEE